MPQLLQKQTSLNVFQNHVLLVSLQFYKELPLYMPIHQPSTFRTKSTKFATKTRKIKKDH